MHNTDLSVEIMRVCENEAVTTDKATSSWLEVYWQPDGCTPASCDELMSLLPDVLSLFFVTMHVSTTTDWLKARHTEAVSVLCASIWQQCWFTGRLLSNAIYVGVGNLLGRGSNAKRLSL